MNAILRKLDRGRHLLSAAAYPALWQQWRLPAGVSLALSFVVLALVLSAAYVGGDQAAASPLAQPYTMIINRGEGDCPLCRQSDPNYDPEMGYFNLNCSGCPINDTTYVWSRTPFYTDPHSLGSPPYNSFNFWLHRNKGCGDFQMWGMSGNDTVTNIAPFSIPCTGSLGNEPITGGSGNDTIGTTFSPGPGTLFFSPGQGGYDFPTLFTEGPTDLTNEVQNRTDTWIQGSWSDTGFPSPGPGSEGPWVRFPPSLTGYSGGPHIQASSGPKAIPPRGSATFTVTMHPDWSQVPQAMGVAAASPARVTGTLVFSFGPTARISQTLVIARPQRVFVPLAMKEWGSGW